MKDLFNTNEQIENLKDLEKKISNKELITQIKKISIIPNELNEYTKIVEFGDLSFISDFDIQEKIGKLIFTKKQLDDMNNSDFMYSLYFLYKWVYGFKNIENEFKVTPNTTNLNLIFSRADAIKMQKEDNQDLALKLSGVNKEDLSEWERDLVMVQISDALTEPLNTSAGFLQNPY